MGSRPCDWSSPIPAQSITSILIEQIDILPRLCESVVLPTIVREELSNEFAPASVRKWIAAPPIWLQLAPSPDTHPIAGLHRGEASAIALASSLAADLLLMDDRRGVLAAERQGIVVTGTLGILDLAAERGMLDFAEAVERLEATSFRRPLGLLQTLLEKHAKR